MVGSQPCNMMPSEASETEGAPNAVVHEVVPRANLSLEATAREKRYLAALSFGLGACQGCGVCFYVGAGGYFGSIFDDNRFFVNACAFCYSPPILISLVQLLMDRHFDALLGMKIVLRFRI